MEKKTSEISRLIELEKHYADYGFDWPNTESIFEQIQSEVREVKSAIEGKEGAARIQEEMGDLLHGVISLIRFSGYEVESILSQVNHKFESRCETMKAFALKENIHSFKGLSFEEMLRFWNLAKGYE